MKLHTRFKKTVAMAVVATTVMTAMPAATFASDYTGHWAQNVIEAWKDKGIINGYEDGTFKPKNQVTRAELAKMLSEVFGLTNKEGAEKFKDIQTDNWHSNYVELVSAAGLMTGSNGEFRPNEPATREEAAYALAQAYHVVGSTDKTYADQVQVSTWAVESVQALVANGYINGYPDGTFKPQGHITRAEIVVMLDRMTAEIVNKGGVHTKDTEGNLVVNTKGVTLKDMTINGNLYLAEGIGEGDVTLDGVTVTGDIIVEGGGINSVHIKGKSKAKNIKVSKAGENPVRLAIQGSVTLTGIIQIESPTVIQGTGSVINKAILSGGTLELKGSIEIKEMVVTAPTTVTLTGGEVVVDKLEVAKLAEKTTLKGNGQIKEVDVKAEGLKYAGTLTIDKMVVDSAVTTKPSTISNNSGGPSNPVTPVDKSIHIQNAVIFKEQGPAELVSFENGNNLEIERTTINGEEMILINRHIFRASDVITGAMFDTDADKAITFSLADIPFTKVTLSENQQYQISDIETLVDLDNIFGTEVAKGEVEKLIVNLFEMAQDLTPAQKDLYIEKSLKYLDTIETIVRANLSDSSVPVSSIMTYIEKAKDKSSNATLIEAYSKVNKLLKELYGISVEGLGTDNITIKLDINMTASGYKDKLHVTLKF